MAKHDWLTVSPMEGKGNATVINTGTAHKGRSSRSTTVTAFVEEKNTGKTYTVVQRAAESYIEIDVMTFTVPAEGGVITVTGRANLIGINKVISEVFTGKVVANNLIVNGTAVELNKAIPGDPGLADEYTFSVDFTFAKNTIGEIIDYLWLGGIGGATLSPSVEIYVKQETSVYTIKYQAGDYIASVSKDTEIIPYGGTATARAEVQESDVQYDYSFDGWYDGMTKVGTEIVLSHPNITTDKTFIARGLKTLREYILTVVNGTGGGKYPYGTEVTIAPNTIEKKVFKKWDDDVLVPERVVTILGNKTYEAIFANLYDVIYQAGEGVVSVSREHELVEDGLNGLGSVATLQEGYNFDGWYDGENKSTEELMMTPTNVVEDKTYIAKAIIQKFLFELYYGDRVTDPELNHPFTAGKKKLRGNNGYIECNYEATDNIPYGGEVTATAYDGERGYFLGWKDSATGEIVDTSRTKVVTNITTPITLYAQFQTSWFVATILLGEGIENYRIGSYNSPEIITDKEYHKRYAYNGVLRVLNIVPKEGFQSRVGYEIISGTVLIDPSWSDPTAGWTFYVRSDLTVKIFSTLQAFTVTYNLNGGNVDGNVEPIVQNKNWGDTLAPLPPIPTKDTFVFYAWSNVAEGVLGEIFTGDSIVKSDLELYAWWKPLIAVIVSVQSLEWLVLNGEDGYNAVDYPDNNPDAEDVAPFATKYVTEGDQLGGLPTLNIEYISGGLNGAEIYVDWMLSDTNDENVRPATITSVITSAGAESVPDMSKYPVVLLTPLISEGVHVVFFPYYDTTLIDITVSGVGYTDDIFKAELTADNFIPCASTLRGIGGNVGVLPNVEVHTDGVEFLGFWNGIRGEMEPDITEDTIITKDNVLVSGGDGVLGSITPVGKKCFIIVPIFKDNRVYINLDTQYRDGNNTGDWVNGATGGTVETDTFQVAIGGSCTVTALPNEGYEFVAWVVDDVEIGTTSTYTIENIQGAMRVTARFQKKYFEVQVGLNSDDQGTVSGDGLYAYGTEVTISVTRKRGYKFVEWQDMLNGDVVVSTNNTYTFTITEERWFFAAFEAIEYSIPVAVTAGEGVVKFTADGYQQDDANYTDLIGGNKTAEFLEGQRVWLKAYPAEHYHFVRWDFKWVDEDEVKIAEANPDFFTISVVDEINFEPKYEYVHAVFEADEYTHTFNANGGNTPVPASITKKYGESLGSLPTCTREANVEYSYTLKGWFTATSGGTQATIETVVTGDTIWYAQWTTTPRTYVITWDCNGGDTQTENSRTLNYGSTLGTLPTATKAGHTFLGWFTAASGGTQVSNTTAVTGAATYYAHWQANNITFTFNANGGNAPSSTTIVKMHGSQVGTLPTCTRNSTAQYSYSFIGWFNTSATTGGTQCTTSTTMTENTTWYARWQSTTRSYTVSYQTTYGTLNKSSQSVSYGSTGSCTLTVPANTAQFTYEFKGWFTAANGGGTKVGSSTTLTTPTISGAVTYYAYVIRTTRSYAIGTSLHSTCAGRGTLTGAGTYNYGASVTVKCTLSKSGDVFDGWYEGSTKVSSSLSYSFTCTGAKTLVAKINWLEVSPTSLTFEAAGGTKSFTISGNVSWTIS